MSTSTTPLPVRGGEARAAARLCPNCGAAADSPYCARCGQRQRDRADLTVRRLADDAVRSLTNLESGLLGTLRRLIFQPGFLTEEFLRGRRQRWVSPAKLYIAVSVVFLAWDAALGNGGWSHQFAPGGPLDPLVRRFGLDAGAFAKRFNGSFTEYTTWLRIGSVLVAALFLAALYRGTRRLYAEHVVFALHYFSVEFILSSLYAGAIVGFGAVAGRQPPAWVSFATYTLTLPYLFVALRRVYGESSPKTAVKAIVLLACRYALYFAVIVVAMAIARLLAPGS